MSDLPRQSTNPLYSSGERPTTRRLEEAGQRVGEAARQVEEQTRPLRGDISRSVERARILAAEGLARAARSLRSGSTGPDTTAQAFAERLDRSADYLRRTDMAGMRRDAVGLVRQYPAQALGAAFVVGLVIGQRLRRE